MLQQEDSQNQPRKINPFMPLYFALVLAIGVGAGYFFTFKNNASVNGFNNQAAAGSKINSLLNFIQSQYVDTINEIQLENKTISSLLKSLDPHSDYIPASELQLVNEPLEGNFDGIGVEFNIIDDTVRVINPIVGGPSEKIGIKAGDRIIKVEKKIIAGVKIKNKDVFKLLRGESGSTVNVTVLRSGVKSPISFAIERGEIPLYSIDISYMATKTIGYIKISRFAETTYDEYIKAFNDLSKKGMKKLILDLRDNGGGFLKIAVDLADEFLMSGLQIVYTQGRMHPKKIYNATTKGGFENNSLVVLIDEGSASASEILAGALQDNDRATIIGRRSFGKGLVQDQVNLTDGSAVRLTIARYYTPTGRCIQKSYATGVDDYYDEEYQRYNNGELYHADSMKIDKTKIFKTPGGKTVYGGGGIIPDIFVPLDTVRYDKLVNRIYFSGAINTFAFDYVDKQRTLLLKKYASAQQFINSFTVTDVEVSALNNYLISKKIDYKLNANLKGLPNLLKALIGRVLFDKDAYFPIINSNDNAFIKAIEVLEKQ